jgi:hypothetical protein
MKAHRPTEDEPTDWLAVFLRENAVCMQRVHQTGAWTVRPEACIRYMTRSMIEVYGSQLATRREEAAWPIARPRRIAFCGHPGIFQRGFIPNFLSREDDLFVWPECVGCGHKAGCDRLRRVAKKVLCYACFDAMRFRVARAVRATLERMSPLECLPRDVRLLIWQRLYWIYLREC